MHPKLLSFWAFYPPDVLPLLVAQRINVFFWGGDIGLIEYVLFYG